MVKEDRAAGGRQRLSPCPRVPTFPLGGSAAARVEGSSIPGTLNSLEGSCPWPGSWSWSHGAHLVSQVRGDRSAFTVPRRRHPSRAFHAQIAYIGALKRRTPHALRLLRRRRRPLGP